MTFALFAYNQERFIREAVQGAFAQIYQPLEIILSDDCSTDRTFEIMQEMAAAYDGPHRVVLNRTKSNAGLLAHVIGTCRQALGEVIVVAAGDDISYPQRVQKLALEFGKDLSTYCVSSGFDLIDEDGKVVSKNHLSALKKIRTFLILPNGDKYITIQGSTAAYRRELFSLNLPEPLRACSEDNLFNFLIYANRKNVRCLPVALVAYRRHQNAIANLDKRKMSARDFEIAARKHHVAHENLLLAMKSVAKQCAAPELVDETQIEQELRNIRLRISWGDLSTRKRLVFTWDALCSFQSSLLIWQLPRLWGRFPDYIPQRYIHLLEGLLRT